MRIAVTGGKGGTGKSTIATAISNYLAENGKKVLLLDLDVDCPNDHLLLGIKIKREQAVETMIPKFNYEKCIKCGRCSKVCRENAIVFVKNKYPFLVKEQCIGCRACKIACPTNAIEEEKQTIGWIYKGKKDNLTLISGRLRPGIEESSLVVNATKKYAKKLEKKFEYVIIDTAAGTHCPVIAALLEADVALAVTEPTPLAINDLKLILNLLKKMKLRHFVVLNKANIAAKREVEKITKQSKTRIIAEIPYSREIIDAYAHGRAVKFDSLNEILKAVE
ncbi:MAG: ATP-binding protein [Candidatus Diapherotrites archaeon]|nr:ATP-binding protein [Candidatus Diapherotrites archaeon]